MIEYCLVFPDRATAISVLSDFYQSDTGSFISTPAVTVLDVGDYYRGTGEMVTDAEGIETEVQEQVPGYHVNILSRYPIENLDSYVVSPDTASYSWFL